MLDESQAGINTARRNINNLRYADDTTLMAESEELKSLLMRVKEENAKAGLKLNSKKKKTNKDPGILSHHFMTNKREKSRSSQTLFSWVPTSLSEKAMAPYSSTPAWKILWKEEPGRLQSMGSLRVRHD